MDVISSDGTPELVSVCVEVIAVEHVERDWQRAVTFRCISPFKNGGIAGASLARKKVRGRSTHTYLVNVKPEIGIPIGLVELQVEFGFYANMKYVGPCGESIPIPLAAHGMTGEGGRNFTLNPQQTELTTSEPPTEESAEVYGKNVSENEALRSDISILRSEVNKLKRQNKDLNDLITQMARILVDHVGKNAKLLHEKE